VAVFLIVFCAIVFFSPEVGGYFLEYNNFVPADPLTTPAHIAPVWYFTPFYAMLRAVPSFFGMQVWGVAVMGAATLVFFVMPWLDRGKAKSIRYRGPLFKSFFAAFVVSFLVLGYLGVEPTNVWGEFPKGVPFLGGDYIATWVARVLTAVYFAFFLLMPWYSAVDKEKPVPQRVTY
jgi:ubiquinol-cytochrome c reductase cytochrome b subunit